MQIDGSNNARLTTNVANDWDPVWSPDSRQVLFGSDRGGGPGLPAYIKQAVDLDAPEIPVTNSSQAPTHDWSRDGQWLLASNGADIWIKPGIGEAKPFPYLATQFRETGGRFSPDGQWIAYVSDETSHFEVFVRRFTGGPPAGEGRLQLSRDGGDYPVWGPRGEELFFLSPDSSLYAVDTRALVRSATAPPAVRLFQACRGTQPSGIAGTGQTYWYPFDTHDGQRFLIDCQVQPAGRYHVLLNWRPADQ
jgi:Tol biopolymer transport system component